MQPPRKVKFLGLRLTQSDYDNLERLSSFLSQNEGKPVTLSSVVTRLIDAGLPILEQEIGTNVSQIERNVSLLAAARSFRSGLNRLDHFLTQQSNF